MKRRDIDLTITPSPMRRILMLVILVCLGIILVALGFSTTPQGVGFRIILILSGACIVAFAPIFHRATSYGLTLDKTHLRDGAGRELCSIDNIKAVERGAFAFKPSNGFLVRLHDPAPRGWAPGLWWRFGRMIGVGGILAASQTRTMAEVIAVRIAEDTKSRAKAKSKGKSKK